MTDTNIDSEFQIVGSGGGGGGNVSSVAIVTTNYSQAEYGSNPRVNLATGSLKYAFADLDVGYGNYQVGLAHIFTSQTEPAFKDRIQGFGNGFKLNVTQLITEVNGKILYLDSEGYVHRFVKYTSDKYYDDRNAKTVLEKSDYGYTVTDGVGNKLIFDSDGTLIRSVSCHDDSMEKIYEYLNGRLVKVYDRRTVTNGKAKNRLELAYNAHGNLSAVTAYVNFNTKRLGLKYGYDANGNLVTVSKTAYNKMGEEVLNREILRFSYDTSNRLCLIADAQSKQATQILYSQYRVNKLSLGLLKDTCISVGATDAAKQSAANCGSTRLGELTQSAFIAKSYQKFVYSYLTAADELSYQTDITNENGITLTYFIDRSACITGSFEKVNGRLKTLSKQGAKRTDGFSSNGETYINGRQSSIQSGEKVILTGASFEIARNKAEQTLKRFGYSFWLKLRKFYNVAEAELTYKFKHGELSVSKVYVDGHAKNAWQRVTLPLTAPQNKDNEQAISPLELLRVKLITNKGVCSDEYEISEIGFASTSHTELMLSGHYAIGIPFTKSEKVSYGYLDNSYNTQTVKTEMSRDFYFTESDVIATYTNSYAHAYYQIGKKLYDVICNNGTKRISNVEYLMFSGADGVYSSTSHIPFASVTTSADGETVITAKYVFDSLSMTIETTGKREDKTSSTSIKMDYTGKKIKETDEYGITKEYTYNAYGDVTKVREIASDGTVGRVESYGYADGKLITSTDGLTGQKLSYGYFDQADKVTETDSSGNETPRTIKTGYGAYCDRPQSVTEYNGSEKISENKVTYENGRIRTVTDGTAKYGVKYDYENNTVEYTQFNEFDEEQTIQRDTVEKIGGLVKHRSDYIQSNYETGFSETNVDLYGKTLKVSNGTDNVDEEEVYFYYDTTTESRLAVKPISIDERTKNTVTEYTYDDDGNLTGWKESKGGEQVLNVKQISSNTTKYTLGKNLEYFAAIEYDENAIMNPRVTGISYMTDSNADNDQTIQKMGMFKQSYKYDAFGRLTSKENKEYTRYNYEYKTVGQASLLYKSDFKNYTEDEANNPRITKVRITEELDFTDRGEIKDVKQNYSWRSRSTGMYVDKGVSNRKSYGYDSSCRLTHETNSILNLNRTYEYRADGRIKEITDNKYGTRSYGYDTQGRLTSVSQGSRYIPFTYDVYGNRTSKVEVGELTRYTYAYGNKLTSVSNPAVETTYEYNMQGVRTQKQSGSIITKYLLDGNKIISENRTETGKPNKGLDYFYDSEGLMGFDLQGAQYLYVKDMQGNVAMILSWDKRVQARYEYDAMGNCTVYDEDGRIDTNPESVGNINPFRWKSFYFDTETGLYYANGSYYDPETGTYLDASPVYTIEKLSTHNLDRNGLMCNNVLELSCNPYTINTVTELYPDPAYEIGERKIQWWHWVIGGAFALGSFILAAVTCGLTIAITATLIGAGVGAAYGAFTAHTAGQDVAKGALVGMLSGVIMGNTAAIGTSIMSGAILVAPLSQLNGNVMAGLALSAVGGAFAGAYSELGNQLNNYGEIVDPVEIGITALEYGTVNVLSMLIGIPTVNEKEVMMILVGTWLFDMIIGGISAAIDVLRGGLKKK